MSRKLLIIFLVFFMTGLAWNLPAASRAAETDVAIGGGVGAAPDYEGSDEYEAVPLPFASVRWDNGRFVELAGNTLRANLLAHNILSLGPILQYIPERDDVDSDAVDAMEKVDTSVMVGAFARVKFDSWYARLHAIQDVADGNDGFLVQVGGGYNWFYSDTFRMIFDVFSTYASEDYMETYFEVDALDSARSGLRQYTDVDAGIKDVGLAITANCRPYENWSFRSIVSYKRLLGDAEDSPVVDDEGDASQFSAGVMVVYHF
ncbi:MAG: MipA/OmpV family protein [Desulfobacterales bacterium]|nr:MAG: MipA/OmpV family protein [Desulfobacterales bacterium]